MVGHQCSLSPGGTSSCCFSHYPEHGPFLSRKKAGNMLGQLRSCPSSAYARSCSLDGGMHKAEES